MHIMSAGRDQKKQKQVTLQDVNATSCELPKPLTHSAVIENPCNNDEILIFGGYKSSTIYIYNKTTNSIKEHDESLPSTGSSAKVAAIYALNGNNKRSIILIWKEGVSGYAIFNCKTKKFTFTLLNTVRESNGDPNIPDVTYGSTVNRYQNWLFIVGGYYQHNRITLYDIRNEESPIIFGYMHINAAVSNAVQAKIDEIKQEREKRNKRTSNMYINLKRQWLLYLQSQEDPVSINDKGLFTTNNNDMDNNIDSADNMDNVHVDGKSDSDDDNYCNYDLLREPVRQLNRLLSLGCHGTVVMNSGNNSNINGYDSDYSNQKNEKIVKLFIFGGKKKYSETIYPFNQLLFEFEINLSKLDLLLDEYYNHNDNCNLDTAIATGDENDHDDKSLRVPYHSGRIGHGAGIDILTLDKGSCSYVKVKYNLKKWQIKSHQDDINCKDDKDGNNDDNDNDNVNNMGLSCFSYHLYNSRYLIIIGGTKTSQHKHTQAVYDAVSDQFVMVETDEYYIHTHVENEIMCYDFETCMWHRDKNWNFKGDSYDYNSNMSNYRLCVNGLTEHSSVLTTSKNNLCLYIFGGKQDVSIRHSWLQPKSCFKLNFSKDLDWEIERLIWIAYLKGGQRNMNDTDKRCKIALLPKVLVALVLSFIKRVCIFE